MTVLGRTLNIKKIGKCVKRWRRTNRNSNQTLMGKIFLVFQLIESASNTSLLSLEGQILGKRKIINSFVFSARAARQLTLKLYS